jgi:hydroxylaminobenzene mutase
MTETTILGAAGLSLFMLGLINGFLIPVGRSPRLGLSAHLTGVQSGTFLIAVGLFWPQMHLAPAWSMPLAHATWISLYAVWFSLLLAGLFGAGRGLPIAGQGIETTRAKQTFVSILLIGGSLGIALAIAAMLIGWAMAA